MRASSDRISALRRMPATDLAALLGRVPALAESLTGDGPLSAGMAGHAAAERGERSLTHLGILMASPRGIVSVIETLNRLERQLLVLAAVHDGRISTSTVVAEAGDAREIDQAAAALASLSWPTPRTARGTGWCCGQASCGMCPSPVSGSTPRSANLSGADLDMLLQQLGAEEIPYRHEDRRRLVGRLLRRPAVAEEVLQRVDADAAGVLDLLIDHGDQRVADLGMKPFDPWDRRGGPLHMLVQRGLAGVDLHTQRAFTWVDLKVGLRGRLFDDWPLHPPAIDPRPLADPGASTPRAIRRLHMLLDHWSREPVIALSAGGIGVRPVRAAARRSASIPATWAC